MKRRLGIILVILLPLTALAARRPVSDIYLSPQAGFMPAADHKGSPLVTDTAIRLDIPAAAGEFRLDVSLADLSAKTSLTRDSKAPGYKIVFTDTEGERIALHVSPFPSTDNGLRSGYTLFATRGREPVQLKDPLFPSEQGEAVIQAELRDGSLTFTAVAPGREQQPIFAIDGVRGDRIVSAAIEPDPGATLRIGMVRLRLYPSLRQRLATGLTARQTDGLLARLPDPSQRNLSGRWKILDYDLDDKYLQLGGDYTLAIVPAEELPLLAEFAGRNPGSRAIVYLGGASAYGSEWEPGMLKGLLIPTGILGIWRTVWIDPEGNGLQGIPFSDLLSVPAEATAQTDDDASELTISFPNLYSSIRLIRF